MKDECVEKKIDAVLISLDAKKAFDSVDHKYIEKTLKNMALDLNLFNSLE